MMRIHMKSGAVVETDDELLKVTSQGGMIIQLNWKTNRFPGSRTLLGISIDNVEATVAVLTPEDCKPEQQEERTS